MGNKKPMPITEKGNRDIIDQWYKDAKEQTMDSLPDFINHVINDYQHDYGTQCHATAACSVATAWATGIGITGFQASCIMWEFIRHWYYESNSTGLRLINFDNMLYPQYEQDFDKAITPEVWERIQKEAQKHLDKNRESRLLAHPDVIAHWKSIVNGVIPFGYKLKQKI